jgi:hypothetical protein
VVTHPHFKKIALYTIFEIVILSSFRRKMISIPLDALFPSTNHSHYSALETFPSSGTTRFSMSVEAHNGVMLCRCKSPIGVLRPT